MPTLCGENAIEHDQAILLINSWTVDTFSQSKASSKPRINVNNSNTIYLFVYNWMVAFRLVICILEKNQNRTV